MTIFREISSEKMLKKTKESHNINRFDGMKRDNQLVDIKRNKGISKSKHM